MIIGELGFLRQRGMLIWVPQLGKFVMAWTSGDLGIRER